MNVIHNSSFLLLPLFSHQLFGDDLNRILEELNMTLTQ